MTITIRFLVWRIQQFALCSKKKFNDLSSSPSFYYFECRQKNKNKTYDLA